MSVAFRPVGDHALLVDFGGGIDEATFARVVALDRALADDPPPGLAEAVPAYGSLLLVFDVAATDHAALEAAVTPRLADATGFPAAVTHEVPVRYDGPDLAEVAARLGAAPDAVATTHMAGDYRVFMYGFAPGYAYLGGVPAALHLPRKPAAVRGHPVGSVMIAGAQCLVATLPMPTGWWVIGHTELRVLRPDAAHPFLFAPGDRVRFVAA